MARPAKSTKVKSGTITKEEEATRSEIEDRLRGKSEKLEPPDYLTDEQKKIFGFVCENLVEAEILSNLDVYVLCSLSIAVSRLQQIEQMVNDMPEYLFDTALMGARSKYQSDMWRGCNELCLSPQARAKIGSLAAQAIKHKEDPLLKALMDDD